MIVPRAAVSSPSVFLPAGLNGIAVTGAVSGAGICGGRPGWPGTAMFASARPSAPISGVGRDLASGPP